MPPSQPPIFDPNIALALTSVTKTFGRVRALDSASFTVRKNTIHALLGENGAGKTTLMRMAFGMIQPDEGSIVIDREVRRFRSSADAIAAGIGMVHQHFTLVPAMSVAENIALGGHGRYRAEEVRAQVRQLAEVSKLPVDPDAIVATLPVSAQQRVEILKALSKDARILILDEPTAVLAPDESRELLYRIREFASTRGTVILITHKLRDALEFADEVTVLRRGRTVLTVPTSEIDERQLTEAMIGTSTQQMLESSEESGNFESSLKATLQKSPINHSGTHRVKARDVFRLRNVNASDSRGIPVVKNVSLAVHGGEIFGVAAVEGSGQHELLRLLAGRIQPETGFVEIPASVGFIPEDRHRDAMILDFPLYENVALAGASSRQGRIDWKAIRRETVELMETYDVRAPNPETRGRTLSGGNQQKLVVGREINVAPHAIVAENPTRGLDVQATFAVHQRLRDARDQGAAIVFYSSDLDEVLEIADRVAVMYTGSLYEVPKDREVIGRVMLSGTLGGMTDFPE